MEIVCMSKGYGPQTHVMILLYIFPQSVHLIENAEGWKNCESGRWTVEDECYLYFYPADDIPRHFLFS